ncbi:hypothetical protein [Flagellimonas algicola]|uniref:Lipoprotein n=1 Tax=Flagellimonas algicola TaxID=2583815 RepID=A0ABY2WLE5_9FLAO|nr:hypothetical protein [Allomuricauda algicola]TMU55674.1 hypothetical protein FGG15_16045 [Allomuricauda algicola]
MNKTLIYIIIILTFSGCSYITDFYIINSSDQNISIEYKVKDFELSGPFVSTPYLTKMSRGFEYSSDRNYDSVVVDSINKKVSCKLEKGQSLWFGDDLNFSIKNLQDQQKLKDKIVYLKISIEHGVLMANESNIVSSLTTFDRQHVGIEVE